MRSMIRAFLLVCVALLLVMSAFAPRLRAAAQGGQQVQWPGYPNCTFELLNEPAKASFASIPNGGVTQPVVFTGNVAACSLMVAPSYSYGVYEVLAWQADLMLPDPRTVALRSVALDVSDLLYQRRLVSFSPPIVVRSLAHVADSLQLTGALDFHNQPTYATTPILFDSAGTPQTPAALRYAPDRIRVPAPGPHPVLATSICGGDVALQDLRVVQSVTSAETELDLAPYDVIQRFRVPGRVRVHWVELAISMPSINLLGSVSILDGQGPSVPPIQLPVPLVSASFYPEGTASSVWATHFDFDSSVVLLPNHDYWLLATPAHGYRLRTHTLTGSESLDFTSAIGPCYSRTESGGIWTAESGRALSFRAIGELLPTADVPPPVQRGSLHLEASPNPARGSVAIAWSGAHQGVRFDVLDARGRRVASAAGVAGSAGRWTWNGVRAAGQPLPAGLYFVRATDDAGASATARVVLVR